jgi:hypothetical protein
MDIQVKKRVKESRGVPDDSARLSFPVIPGINSLHKLP